MKIFSHNVWTIFGSVLLAVLCTVPAKARTELLSISAGDRNTVTLFFSELPAAISSELAPDKKRIILRIDDATATEKAREAIEATDAVELVSLQQNGKNITIYIVLREKYGFTQAALPYSQALRLYIVDWEKLSQQDNLFHSGLLSLDSKLSSTAREYFRKAAQAGSGDAAAMAGLSLLAEGKTEEAQAEFTRAIDLGTSIPDVYAAISDMAAARGDTQRATHFSELYTRKTRRRNFPSLAGALRRDNTEFAEPRTLAESLLAGEQPPVDTTADATAQTDSLLNERVSEQARSLLADTTASRSTPLSSPNTSLVPSWMKWTVYSVLLFFCAAMLGLAYLYVRWRRKQLAGQAPAPVATEPEQSAFEREIDSALQSVTARKAAAMYAQARQDNTDPAAAEPEPPAPVEESPRERSAPPDTHFSFDDMPEEKAPEPAPETHAADDVDALARKLRKGRGELDLAVKLLARKKQDGKEKTVALDADEIPDKPASLSRLARRLGVGTGALEIKKNLETSGEKEKEEKFRSLFGGRRHT